MAKKNKVDELIDSLPKKIISAKIPLILNINKGYFKEIESKTVNGKYRDIEVRVFDLGYTPEDYMFICERMDLELK